MKYRSALRTLSIVLLFSTLSIVSLQGQINFPSGSAFRYLKGSAAANLTVNWINSSFDDSGWSQGNAPFRYGDGTGGTLLDDMRYTYSTVYMRSSFTVQNADKLGDIGMKIDYDDGFVIWINGVEVLKENAPSSYSYDATAPENHESGQFESFLLEPGAVDLVEGENTLAIQGFNYSLESTDFMMDLEIHAETTEPVLFDSTGLDFSVPAGFYQDPFSLEITASDPSWQVVYTLDGSNPQHSQTAIIAGNKATIQIDPSSLDNRPGTPGVTVRASSATSGYKYSIPETRTYIFLENVLGQPYPGGGWPDYNVNGQLIDLGMDQRVVFSSEYRDQMIPSLTDIPSISVVTDLDNLFGPDIGIYVNAWGHGMEWERECSVELLNPDGSDGFNVNAGLRIRGGWSRHDDFPKHAFRLFFRSKYGDAKLDYPLFGDEGVDHYDKIDLRTSQNYAWAQGDNRNTMLRDVFARDAQRDMGQPYTRSRYYHLYLNGMYWGLFQTQERSEARFAADYLGGNTNDYDVVKVNTENWSYRIEATDGSLDTWEDIWNMCGAGLADNEDYFHLLGRDKDGKPVAGGKVLVDIDNLIDYMLSIFYTGNFDAPTSSFGSNKGPNNFYAIYNREDYSAGFTFYNHDAEHAMFADVASPGTGLYEDRVNLAERTDGMKMNVSNFSAFHPQWLHHILCSNEEYRIRFMDRAYMHLARDGALTPAKNLARLNQRASEMEMAIIAESARWGDAKRSESFTKNDDWIPQANKIREDFIPYRTQIVIDQLENAGLYSEIEPAVVSISGHETWQTEVHLGGAVTLELENKNGYGTIYYTTNGKDPRAIGGVPVSGAHSSGNEDRVSLDIDASAVVKARIEYMGDWSAIREIHLLADQEDYSDLVITEIHYHPMQMVFAGDTIPSKDFEFIEFKNIGTETLNLGGLVLDSAVYHEFPAGTLLPSGQFYVVVSKPNKFYLRYGLEASGNYSRNLSNGGEEILLQDPDGNPLIHFMFSDTIPWPVEPDGQGYSLVSQEINPMGNPAEYTYWKKSMYIGGSPFKNDPFATYDRPVLVAEEDIMLYPNPTSGVLNIRWPEGVAPQEADFELYGLNGQLLYRTGLYDDQPVRIDHLGLSSGVYIVKISMEGQVFRKKIVYR
jgi:hypothetical protein